MPVSTDAVGREGSLSALVGPQLSADAFGNLGLEALATPALVGLFEQAAMRALADLLDGSERSVGDSLEMTHRAPTPYGRTVRVRAVVSSVDGRRVWFEIVAEDEMEIIATGRHSRFVVDRVRFDDRLRAKRDSC